MSVQPLRLTAAAQNRKRHDVLLVSKRHKIVRAMIAGIMGCICIHEPRDICSDVSSKGLANYEQFKLVGRDNVDYRSERFPQGDTQEGPAGGR
ncbi:hypothetical protein BELL_0282g00070 [Botrytis elliptica]|uniref:Uncharacterized protein n=1 Tax=Botrytis elliptica TaxID=278938 RepID=A0A4Z1JLB2_9HELO|nr:hypothetical protein BELL_0282g00070 [Botrytis elliptica]